MFPFVHLIPNVEESIGNIGPQHEKIFDVEAELTKYHAFFLRKKYEAQFVQTVRKLQKLHSDPFQNNENIFRPDFFIFSLDVLFTRFYQKKHNKHFQTPKDQIQIWQNVRNFCSDQKKAFSKPGLSHFPN